MNQYLLSVHSVEGVAPPSSEEMEKIFRDVDALNDEIRGAGAWVFAGGLHPPSTATDVALVALRGPRYSSRSGIPTPEALLSCVRRRGRRMFCWE